MKKIDLIAACLLFLAAMSVSAVAYEKGSMTDDELEKGSMSEGMKGSGHDDIMEKGSMKGDMLEAAVFSMAIAHIAPTGPGSDVAGKAVFTENEDGVTVVVTLKGVPDPGNHGFHIHQNGSCAEAGKAAGGHYNPNSVDHGFLPKDGHSAAHAGDLGNIAIDEDGNGSLTVLLPGLSIADENNVSGRSVILHAKEDDFGQPTGNAGGRIGCGVIISK